tara:strand:- start:268 stop:516 length:249 start_codon:yes stop_codon:yes gene_type:complete
MRDTLIEFMDELREYVAESGTNIAHDERDSSEFVDIFLNKGQTLPIDSVVDSEAELCGKSNCNRQKLEGNVYCSYHYDINFG